MLALVWRLRAKKDGGEGGIRTHGTLARTTVFETVPIDHSGTSPRASKAGSIEALFERRILSEGARPAQGTSQISRNDVGLFRMGLAKALSSPSFCSLFWEK